jgi:hypothetical protein
MVNMIVLDSHTVGGTKLVGCMWEALHHVPVRPCSDLGD